MANRSEQFDTIIVGAGILGLWAARYVIGEGRSVCVLEKSISGAGASGGILGALMSHIPDGWNTKKEFQFQALESLESELEKLTIDTGIDCEYRRCGRIMPLAHEGMMHYVESWLNGARTNWHGRYGMKYLAPGDQWFGAYQWPSVERAEFGASHDEFAARLSPRKLISALTKFTQEFGELREGCEVVEIDPTINQIKLREGKVITGKEIIIANGVHAYHLLRPFMGEMNGGKPIGRGVAGQALLVKTNHDDSLPILYQDGIYIIPHADNLMAIGSTSQNVQLSDVDDFDLESQVDDMAFYDKALELAPRLKHATIVERWYGMRPRNTLEGRGSDPWFEPVPGHENLIALIGGFKITFGIAHCAMDVARGKIEGPRRQKLSWVQ